MKSISQKIRNEVYNKYNGKCAYCGCDILINKFHVDHIEPKFRGLTQDQLDRFKINRIKGVDNISNYNPSCHSCNSSKSTLTIEKWRNEIELKKIRIKRDSSSYNILIRFGCITENNTPIVFYFEQFNII